MADLLIDGEIVLYGLVGTSEFGDGFTSTEVVGALARHGHLRDVNVRINSPGGAVTEGIAIFNALKAHRGRVTVTVDAVAASAASMIAMAGDDVAMRLGSLMMIHDPACLTFGDAAEHERAIISLDRLGDAMADIYAEKTGRPPAELRTEMRAERWLTAEEAVAAKFADRLDGANSIDPVAFDYRRFQNAPQRVVAMADARAWSKPPPHLEVKPSAGMMKIIGQTMPRAAVSSDAGSRGSGGPGAASTLPGCAARPIQAVAAGGRPQPSASMLKLVGQPQPGKPREAVVALQASSGRVQPSAGMLKLIEAEGLAGRLGGTEAGDAGVSSLPAPSVSMLKLIGQGSGS